jgi:cell wall-associated NlpC family hydrolase
MATPSPVGLRRRLPVARRAAVVLAALVSVLIPALPASATPSSSAEAAELVAAKGHELEAVTEQFNEARETLVTQHAAAEAAVAQLQQAQAALATAQQQVRGVARAAYTGESMGSFRALMTSESADQFVDRVTTLQMVAGHQNEILAQASTASVAAAQAAATAQDAAAQAQATYDAVVAQQKELEAQIADYQAMYDQLSLEEQQAAAAAASEGDRASRDDRSEPIAATGPVVASSQAAQIAVDTALAQQGKPYVWAAAGPDSFDCSGLMQFAYAAAGVSLPHSSSMQSGIGQPVSRDQLQPGDLVFFYSPISHVGMYIGNGQMVHAPTSGDVVKISSIDTMGYYAGATRIAG